MSPNRCVWAAVVAKTLAAFMLTALLREGTLALSWKHLPSDCPHPQLNARRGRIWHSECLRRISGENAGSASVWRQPPLGGSPIATVKAVAAIKSALASTGRPDLAGLVPVSGKMVLAGTHPRPRRFTPPREQPHGRSTRTVLSAAANWPSLCDDAIVAHPRARPSYHSRFPGPLWTKRRLYHRWRRSG